MCMKCRAITIACIQHMCVCVCAHSLGNAQLTETNQTVCRVIAAPVAPAPIINLLDAPNSDFALVSLGKPCVSTLECQARDPYSVCNNGTCECSSPSSRCSAAHTGCHNDTFQCRNGQCISWYFVCDKNKNCDDGSDEEFCTEQGIHALYTTTMYAIFYCRSGRPTA